MAKIMAGPRRVGAPGGVKIWSHLKTNIEIFFFRPRTGIAKILEAMCVQIAEKFHRNSYACGILSILA